MKAQFIFQREGVNLGLHVMVLNGAAGLVNSPTPPQAFSRHSTSNAKLHEKDQSSYFPSEEAKQAVHVRRHKKGQRVRLFARW